jgi:hypothetical protein
MRLLLLTYALTPNPSPKDRGIKEPQMDTDLEDVDDLMNNDMSGAVVLRSML